MSHTPKISVIVPIYNVEKYIKRCLKTIQAQTFKDFEVLLIDDDSPDRSAEIAEEFCKKDKRFRLFHKENGGLSDARNYGLERARGEFISFIDSDDYIHKNFLEVMYRECVDNDADMSYCRFKYSYFNTGLTLPMPFSAKKEVMKKEDALNILIKDNYLHSYAWNKLYRATLFTENDITYPDMYFEDIATSGRLLYHANRIAISDKYLYYYMKRFGSIMSTMNAEKLNDYWLSVLFVRNHIQSVGEYEKYRVSVRSFARKAHFVNIYSIFRQHLIHLDFRKMKHNFDINRDIYRYIISDEYLPVNEKPELPYRLVQPGRKKKKDKKDKKDKKYPD